MRRWLVGLMLVLLVSGTVGASEQEPPFRFVGTAGDVVLVEGDWNDPVTFPTSPVTWYSPWSGGPRYMVPEGQVIQPGTLKIGLTTTGEVQFEFYVLHPDGSQVRQVYGALQNGDYVIPVPVNRPALGIYPRLATAGTATLWYVVYEPAPDTDPPGSPVGVVATAGVQSVQLTWEPNTEADFWEYVVYLDGEPVGETQGTTYTLSGLAGGVSVTVGVAARDTSGNLSAVVSRTVVPLSPDTDAPAAPVGLAYEPLEGAARVTWEPNTEADLASYRLYLDGSLFGTTTETSYTVGVLDERVYVVTVTAVDTAGNESPPAVIEVAPLLPDREPPMAAYDLRTMGGENGTALISWSAYVDPDRTGWLVEVGQEAYYLPSGQTQLHVSGLTGGEAHAVTVWAVDAAGNRSEPLTGTVTPLTGSRVVEGVETAITPVTQVLEALGGVWKWILGGLLGLVALVFGAFWLIRRAVRRFFEAGGYVEVNGWHYDRYGRTRVYDD